MAITVENVQTTAWANSASITITKPTGLAEGDILLAVITSATAGTNRTPNTPSGWTALYTRTGGAANDTCGIGIFGKVADAGDVAASNFTFTVPTATSEWMTGVLYRLTGASLSVITEIDEGVDTGSGTQAIDITKSINEYSTNKLVIQHMTGRGATGTATSFGSFAITAGANPTFTERADEETTNDIFAAVADAIYTDDGAITEANVTYTSSGDPARMDNLLIVVQAQADATATPALLIETPTFFAPSPSAGVTVSVPALLVGIPSVFDATATVNDGSTWVDETRVSGSWVDETKI